MASAYRISAWQRVGYGLDVCDSTSDTAHPRRIRFAKTKNLVAPDAELASSWDACIALVQRSFNQHENKGVEGVEWGHIESHLECDLANSVADD